MYLWVNVGQHKACLYFFQDWLQYAGHTLIVQPGRESYLYERVASVCEHTAADCVYNPHPGQFSSIIPVNLYTHHDS